MVLHNKVLMVNNKDMVPHNKVVMVVMLHQDPNKIRLKLLLQPLVLLMDLIKNNKMQGMLLCTII